MAAMTGRFAMNKEFNRLALMGSAAILALTIGAPAFAQSTNPAGSDEAQQADAAATSPEEAENEIVVTGFRASLENAVAEKKDANQIVESVSAEDIGKLPDSSIAESIARLPGLASQRLAGRSQVISIRGFGPDLSQTLLNGREQTSTGDNRAVEFDQYPSEVVGQVNVYKSPMASIVGQGLVGTVDIRTARPLDYSDQVIAIGARGSYADLGKLNAGSNEFGYRLNGTYIDQFANDTVGVALAASYVSEPYQQQEYRAWGYPENNGIAALGGAQTGATSTDLTRLGLTATVQYRPAPNWTVTADGFYSNFKDEQIQRTIELPLVWASGDAGTVFTPGEIRDGQVVTGRFDNVEAMVRNDALEREADLYSGGLNVAYEGNDGWSAFFDFGYSRTDRNELKLETNAGTAYGIGTGATDDITFVSGPKGTTFDGTLDYSDPSLILLTDALGWGGSRAQAGYSNNRIVEDVLKQYRVGLAKEFEGSFISSVQFGANYTDRDKSLTPDEHFLLLAGGATEMAIPSKYLLDPTDLSHTGLGNIISYDPMALLRDGIYVRDRNLDQNVLVKGYSVREDLLTFYTQANIEAELGSALLTGNFGVQAIHTDQDSTGFIFLAGTPLERTFSHHFWDVLPSLNLSLRLPSDWVFRVAAAREIQRPRLDDMRVSIGYGWDTTEQIISGSGGNPALRPYRANAIDFTVEKYFGRAGYVAAQFFYKDLKNYIYTSETAFDYSVVPLPSNVPADANLIGRISQPINGEGGSMYGVELAGTLPFETFISTLEGFGVTGGVSYTKSHVRPSPTEDYGDIPGYSRWVANGTAYFEKWGFSARGSVRYRSTFVGELSGYTGNRERRRAAAETIVDAQIGYDFQPGSTLEGLSLYLQGQNLTNEPFLTHMPDAPLQVVNYQTYGRRFLAGFGYKF
jgi:iron complex outermembrane receptor protein